MALTKSDPLAQAYEQLRDLAGHCFAGQGAHHTLQPTALVHEAWMRLRDHVEHSETNATRGPVLAQAAKAMRHVLVDHARRQHSAKRGGGWMRVTLADAPAHQGEEPVLDTIALHEALEHLAASDPELAELAELRLFGGMSVADSAEILGWPLSTTKNRWNCTVALLSLALRDRK